VRVLKVERILPPAVGEAIDPQEVVRKNVVEHHVAQATAALAHCLGLRQRREPQRHEQLKGGYLRLMFLSSVETTLNVHQAPHTWADAASKKATSSATLSSRECANAVAAPRICLFPWLLGSP